MPTQKNIRIFAAFCLFFTSLLIFPLLSLKAQNISSAGFTVRAIIPDNQIDKSKSYFDLLMKPGQTQIIKVEIINNSQQEMTIDVLLRTASTNRNGLIEYQVAAEPDETLKKPFDTISAAAGEITIPSGGSKTAEIILTMPDEQFDGVILGGIIFTRRGSDNTAQGVSISNQFSYAIGVKLSETDKEILPDFRIKSIEPTLVNYRKAVSIAIHNPVALIIKNASISAYIYKANQTEPLFSVNKNGIDMAPNSILPLPVEWEGENMESGEYRLVLKLNNNGQIWEWDQNFNIASDQANDINSDALDKRIKENWLQAWWWIILLIAAFIFLIWAAFLLGRRKRDEDNNRV